MLKEKAFARYSRDHNNIVDALFDNDMIVHTRIDWEKKGNIHRWVLTVAEPNFTRRYLIDGPGLFRLAGGGALRIEALLMSSRIDLQWALDCLDRKQKRQYENWDMTNEGIENAVHS